MFLWPHRKLVGRYAKRRVADGQYCTVLSGQRIHTALMANGASVELHAKWVAAQDIGRFQELLNAETEDGKYKVLAQLLSYELDVSSLTPGSALRSATR
jgi:hypothetical protein